MGVTTQWEFNFSGGYIDQAHVKVLVTDTLGNETAPSAGTVSVRFDNQTRSAVDVAEGTLVQVLKI